jgi:class 3 adenylate cyclase
LRTSAAVALIGVFLIVAVLAGLVVRYGPPGFNALRGWYPSLFAVWAPFRPPAWPADSASNIPLYALVSWLLLLLYALAAALSGVGKLIAAATEPLVAMRLAFDEGARGQLSTRIRPAGPREASLLAESHGRMLDALANLRELERRFNPKSNAALERLRALASGGVLPPKERVATVLAAELRDVAANLRAAGGEPMVALFGRLFESVVAVADQFGGHVERLGSDMLLLIFNAPFEQDDHVVQGTRCAIELQKQIGALNRDAAIRSLGSFNLAIGVATGPIHVGTTSEHPDGARFVLVGDTIELAERLAALTPNGHVWVNQHNAETLPMYIPSVMLAAVNLRGRAQAVAPYRVWPPP